MLMSNLYSDLERGGGGGEGGDSTQMPKRKRKNAAKARVLNNLKHKLPEQPMEAGSIVVGENRMQNLI